MFKKDNLETPSNKVDTLIGKDTYLKGSISGKGLIRIDGEVEGSISTKGDFIIGESGKVSAELKARNITIAGYYKGTLEAEGKLELKKTATASGAFKANKLLIEQGAVLSGNLEMEHKEQTVAGSLKQAPGADAATREWNYETSGSAPSEEEKSVGVFSEKPKE